MAGRSTGRNETYNDSRVWCTCPRLSTPASRGVIVVFFLATAPPRRDDASDRGSGCRSRFRIPAYQCGVAGAASCGSMQAEFQCWGKFLAEDGFKRFMGPNPFSHLAASKAIRIGKGFLQPSPIVIIGYRAALPARTPGSLAVGGGVTKPRPAAWCCSTPSMAKLESRSRPGNPEETEPLPGLSKFTLPATPDRMTGS